MVEEPDEPQRHSPVPSVTTGNLGGEENKGGKPDYLSFERRLRELDGDIYAAKGALSRIRVDAQPEALRQSSLSRIKSLELQKSQCHDEKKKLCSDLTALTTELKALCEEQSALRLRLPFVSEEELNREVGALQARQAHSSITLKEEKRILAEIKELELSRPSLQHYLSRTQQISIKKQDQTVLRARNDALWGKITALGKMIEEEKLRMKDSCERAKTEGPQLKDRLEKLELQRSAIVEKFEEEVKAYKDRQKLVKLAEIIKKRLPNAREHRRTVEERKRHPLDDHILKCNFTVEVLRRHLPVPQAQMHHQSQRASHSSLVVAEGEELLMDKRTREAQARQSWYKGPPKKKPRSKKPVSDPLLHLSMEMVNFISDLGIRVPRCVSEIGAAVECLKRKREELEQMRTEPRKGTSGEQKEDVGSDSTASPSAGPV